MAQILLNINNHKEFKKGDMLIFDGKTFITVDKDSLFEDIHKEILVIKEAIIGNSKSIVKNQANIELINKELAYNRGEISEEEYKECLGGK